MFKKPRSQKLLRGPAFKPADADRQACSLLSAASIRYSVRALAAPRVSGKILRSARRQPNQRRPDAHAATASVSQVVRPRVYPQRRKPNQDTLVGGVQPQERRLRERKPWRRENPTEEKVERRFYYAGECNGRVPAARPGRCPVRNCPAPNEVARVCFATL